MPIKSVGIIGGGPGGLATLYELLHVDQDGNSTVGKSRPDQSRFKVTVFEQKDKAGGIWAPSATPDLDFPPQKILDTENYNLPDVIQPLHLVPKEANSATKENPWVQNLNNSDGDLDWKKSGLYPDLFTNIPSRWTRFSYLPNEEKYLDKNRLIYPFLTGNELVERIENFIEDEKLGEHIRTNSRVEKVEKDRDNKWVLSIRHTNENDTKEEWYQEKFDAIVVANGHYTVPNIPKIKGLAQYNREHPGTLLHAKSYRDQNVFKDKKVLIVGGSISTANLVQYVAPVAKEVFISRRNPHLVWTWINQGLEAKGLNTKPFITEFEGNTVKFSDGSEESDFDVVLFTSGYHYHYPFLTEHLKVIDPSNTSRVKGLYLQTFAIDDPTLAIAGVAISAINFHTIEANAAAIAGVFSGAKTLPPKEEQIKWEEARVKALGDSVFFHYYNHSTVKEEYVDPLYIYAPPGRYNPLEYEWPHIDEIDLGIATLEKLYFKLKDKEIGVKDIYKNSAKI